MAPPKKIFALLISSIFLLTACGDKLGDRYTGFAQCLTDKEVKVYGAYWCPKCDKQKKMFGKKAFKKVDYVECDPRGANANPELCLKKKIEGYPTWEFSDGSMVRGITDLEDLSEKTGCALPPEQMAE